MCGGNNFWRTTWIMMMNEASPIQQTRPILIRGYCKCIRTVMLCGQIRLTRLDTGWMYARTWTPDGCTDGRVRAYIHPVSNRVSRFDSFSFFAVVCYYCDGNVCWFVDDILEDRFSFQYSVTTCNYVDVEPFWGE